MIAHTSLLLSSAFVCLILLAEFNLELKKNFKGKRCLISPVCPW